MLGIFLLTISLLLYVKRKKKYSILLYLLFMTQGLRIFTDDILGVKNLDLAFIYTITICIYSFFHERRFGLFKDKILNKLIWGLFIFLIISAYFSRYYYGFTWYQILQGGRHHFLFLGYFFLRKIKKEDVIWIFHFLFYFTLIHSVLYCIQVITQLPVLPYGEFHIEEATGLARYYNSPVLLTFYLYLCSIFPHYLRTKHTKYAVVIFLVTLFCTQGRTYISLTIFCLIIGLLLRGQTKKIIKNVLILSIAILPFADMLIARFDEGGTDSDLNEILTGQFMDRAYTGDMRGGTMSYRLAWVYERMLYLNNRPISENIFGLGMISDSQSEIVQSKYRFWLGLTNKETGETTQLVTPDIAYGNLITQFGYVGGLILLSIWIKLFFVIYKRRKEHELIFCMSLLMLNYIIGSISGSSISTTGNLIIPFLVLALIHNTQSYSPSYESKTRKVTFHPQKPLC